MDASTATPETAINIVINDLLTTSVTYISLHVYFDRNNVALKGFAKFFKDLSDREREYAVKLMKYQRTRGGRVWLQCIEVPSSEVKSSAQGDALYAMDITLFLQKKTLERLVSLTKVARRYNDPGMIGYIDREFMEEKLNFISYATELITQLKMLGKGFGSWIIDQKLLEPENAEPLNMQILRSVAHESSHKTVNARPIN